MVPVIVVLFLGYLTARQNTMEMFRREAANVMIEVSQRIQSHLDPVAIQSRYLADMITSGETDPSRGRAFASIMTGALAGLSEVSRTAFKRAGIVTIEHSDELFPVAEALTGLPPIRNGRIAILADGGGHATVAADVLSEQGLKIPELGRETRQK